MKVINQPACSTLNEECGVFGIYSPLPIEDIGYYCYSGLFALQHRGQESAGISISNAGKITTYKDMGLVSEVFKLEQLTQMPGNSACAHVRYSTTGGSVLANAQPINVTSMLGDIALAHNGNLINASSLRCELESHGAVFHGTTDSEVILSLITFNASSGLKSAILTALEQIKGGYALSILCQNKLIAVRDPLGIRPLVLGKKGANYVIASESVALDIVGAELIRSINPGEMLIIDEQGIESIQYAKKTKVAHCSFEYIYFSRPDSVLDDLDVYQVRHRAGELLYAQNPVSADIVIGVPDSGVVAALGYSEVSNIPYSMGLVRSKYMGRSFILPTQALREEAVKLKLNPINHLIKGRRVILIDDSLVRGTTAKKLVHLIRGAGAREVHFKVASPQVKSECFYGVDISSKEELIASYMSVGEICKTINADSLDFLSLENQRKILTGNNFCEACFNGCYPL